MRNRHHRLGRPTLLALALAAAFSPAWADEEEDKRVEAAASFGVGVVPASEGDRALFSQYHWLERDRHFGPILGLEYSLRDPEANRWVDLRGTDLLSPQRELGLVWKRPGDWRVGVSYGSLVRREPHTLHSASTGLGTATPTVNPLTAGAGSDHDLKTRRTALGLSLGKIITPALQFDVDLKHEKKEGARLWGRGFACPSPMAPGCAPTTGVAAGWAVLLLPEPIDATHSQVDARLSYARERLRLSVGYYGSFYRNALSTLTPSVPGSLFNATGTLLPLGSGLQAILSQPMALPPDNQAHLLDLSGSYDIAASTRATFKLAFGRATQNDSFAAAGLAGAPAGRGSLDGRVDTTLARLGLTSRPTARLALLGDLRYEERDDRTPLALYNVEGTSFYTNRRLPLKKLRGRAQAQWQFTPEWRGSAGAEYESIDRGVFTASSAVSGISALRQETEEVGVHAELRRRMSEDVSGAVRVSSSRRDGSNWLRDHGGLGVIEVSDAATELPPTAILMPTLADRRRDKVKVFVDWQPAEGLALQVGVEEGRDRYDQLRGYGLGSTRVSLWSLDGSYAINDDWNLTGFAAYGRQALNQSRPFGYIMALRNTGLSAGLGVTGKPARKLEVGAGLSFVNDRSAFRQALDPLAGADSALLLAASGGLPDIVYRQAALKLFGQYELDKQSTLRMDIVLQRSRWNDWAWGSGGVPFTYSDGSTVRMKPVQTVAYVGVVWRHQFR